MVQTIISIITSLITSSLVGFVIKRIFDKSLDAAEDKWQSELAKERDLYKAKLDRIQHRSERNYDTELEIFRNLSVATADMVRDISILVPSGIAYYPPNHDDKLKLQAEQYNNALQSTITAQNSIYGNLPFIPEKFADQYTEILPQSLFLWDLGFRTTSARLKSKSLRKK